MNQLLLLILIPFSFMTVTTQSKYHGPWAPFPRGYTMNQPDNILPLVCDFAKSQPKWNYLGFKNVVIFGDSASDTGREYASMVNKTFWKPYWRGRDSNGPIYPDYLEYNHDLILTNYAHGGATINKTIFNFHPDIPDFNNQIDSYLKERPELESNYQHFDKEFGMAKKYRPLALVYFLGTDLLPLVTRDPDIDYTKFPNSTVTDVIDSFMKNIRKLAIQAKFENIFIIIPTAEGYSQLGYQSALNLAITNFSKEFPQVHLASSDFTPDLGKLLHHPSPLATGPWNQNNKIYCFPFRHPEPCLHPENHLLYESVHPTTATNYQFAHWITRDIRLKWGTKLPYSQLEWSKFAFQATSLPSCN